MSQVLTVPTPPATAPPAQPITSDDFPRKRWTVKECRFLQEAGLLTPGKYELVEGDIVLKMGQSRPHIGLVTIISVLLGAIFGALYLQSQGEMGIGIYDDDESKVEPDITVLKRPISDFMVNSPRPNQEVHLVLEVSVSTLRGDLKAKNRIYARADVPEYWVVNVEGRELIVHRQPGADGYADVVALQETDTVSPLAAPAAQISVRDLLP